MLRQFYVSLIIASVSFIACSGMLLAILGTVLGSIFQVDLHFIYLGILLFALSSAYKILAFMLNAKQKAVLYSLFNIWQFGIGLIFGILFVKLFNMGIGGLLVGSIVSMLLALPILFYSAFDDFRLKSISPKSFSADVIVDMVKYGGPLILSNISIWILSLSDRYLIELFNGSYYVGLYSACYSLTEQVLITFLNLFMLAGTPLIIIIWEREGKDKTSAFIHMISRIYILACLPAAFGFSLLSKQIISVFTAPYYHEGYIIVPFVAFGIFLLGMQWLSQTGLILARRTDLIMYVFLFAGMLNIALNLLLIPVYGYVGSSIATLVSYLALFLVMYIKSKRFLQWAFPNKSLACSLVASAVMSVAIISLNHLIVSEGLPYIVLGIIWGFIVYSTCLLLLGEIRLQDLLGPGQRSILGILHVR